MTETGSEHLESFSIAVIKHRGQKNIYLVILFQKDKCPSQLRDMTAGGHGDRYNNLGVHMFNSKHKAGIAQPL